MLNTGWGGGVCGLTPGAARMSLVHTHLDTGSVAVDRVGRGGPGWLRQACGWALSFPAGHVALTLRTLLRVEPETMSTLDRTVPLSLLLSSPCSPFRTDPGGHGWSVCTQVCACMCLVTALPAMSCSRQRCPSLPAWAPHGVPGFLSPTLNPFRVV